IYIIDLLQSLSYIDRAYEFVKEAGSRPRGTTRLNTRSAQHPLGSTPARLNTRPARRRAARPEPPSDRRPRPGRLGRSVGGVSRRAAQAPSK
ncbi:hypothetical protein ABZ174_34840, partial [Streptomyces sp. NPDC006267]